MELTTEEKARVFAMYLGCPIILTDEPESINEPYDLEAVNLSGAFWTGDDDESGGQGIDEGKLVLTSLDNITDEHAIELEEILMAGVWQKGDKVQRYTIERRKRQLVNDQQEYMTYKAYQYLILKGYAVPLWFGKPILPEVIRKVSY